MRDLLPDAAERRLWLEHAIREVYAGYGYRAIETPALEDLRFLESGQGGENEKLIFKTLRRGVGLEEVSELAGLVDAGLRFDLTVPLARFYASNAAELPSPFRSVQIGAVWRAERPQRGRWRQFTQCDIDILGEPTLLAEAELLSASGEALSAVGLADFTIRLNHRRLLLGLLRACGFEEGDQERVLVIVDKLDKVGVEGVETELAGASYPAGAVSALVEVLAKAQSAATVDELSRLLPPGMDEGVLAELDTITGSVVLPARARVSLDVSLVRGMGYYTGPIFEVAAAGLGSSIAGGGRYDEMIGRIGGRPTPACGFSIGFERLAEVLAPDAGQRRERLALLWREDQDLGGIQRHASRLRREGYAVELVRIAGKGKGVYKRLASAGFDLHAQALEEGAPQELSP